MINSFDMCKVAVNAANEKMGLDIKVLDLKGISTLADYFIIVTASNSNQMEAILTEINQEFHKLGIMQRSTEGNQHSGWILIDYNDIVIHIFGQEEREFYGLDNIWKDAKVVEL